MRLIWTSTEIMSEVYFGDTYGVLLYFSLPMLVEDLKARFHTDCTCRANVNVLLAPKSMNSCGVHRLQREYYYHLVRVYH